MKQITALVFLVSAVFVVACDGSSEPTLVDEIGTIDTTGAPSTEPTPPDAPTAVKEPEKKPPVIIPVGEPDCEPELAIKIDEYHEVVATVGDDKVPLITLTFEAKCASVEISSVAFALVALGYADDSTEPFCDAPCNAPGDWYFGNIKLLSTVDTTFMGPLASPKQSTLNQPARIELTDAFVLEKGKPVQLRLRTDISSKMKFPEPMQYRTLFLGASTAESIPLNMDTAHAKNPNGKLTVLSK